MMEIVRLTDDDNAAVEQAVDAFAAEYLQQGTSRDRVGALYKLGLYAHKLPRKLLDALYAFKYVETGFGGCLVKGIHVDQARIGTTPANWEAGADNSTTLREELKLLLIGSILGDAIGWSTQQNGLLVHNVIPIKGHEKKQMGSSTEETLLMHTEDVFHPCASDYVGLFCLRNFEKAATIFCSIQDLNISPGDKEILFQPLFLIRPDSSHLPDGGLTEGFDDIFRMQEMPSRVSVFYGNADSPYLRVDAVYMEPVNRQAERALENLYREIERATIEITLENGDMCLFDNNRVVHGRRAFSTDYSGNSRWLKRINITRDLRKSSSYRSNTHSRIIDKAYGLQLPVA